jgi:hypothetical protein
MEHIELPTEEKSIIEKSRTAVLAALLTVLSSGDVLAEEPIHNFSDIEKARHHAEQIDLLHTKISEEQRIVEDLAVKEGTVSPDDPSRKTLRDDHGDTFILTKRDLGAMGSSTFINLKDHEKGALYFNSIANHPVDRIAFHDEKNNTNAFQEILVKDGKSREQNSSKESSSGLSTLSSSDFDNLSLYAKRMHAVQSSENDSSNNSRYMPIYTHTGSPDISPDFVAGFEKEKDGSFIVRSVDMRIGEQTEVVGEEAQVLIEKMLTRYFGVLQRFEKKF